MFDYEILRLVWWGLLGVLLIGFAILDGFDMGVAMLLPWVGKTDQERRIIINTIGPVWESNQVWLILGAGAIFAAWPPLYAVAFSGFYIPMFIVLSTLIFRPVAFKFRSKIENPLWRFVWDWALFKGGFIPALIFGVAVGNALQGVPFSFDESLHVNYTGYFYELLNPYALGCGVISVLMMILQGAAYLRLKTSANFSDRLQSVMFICIVALLIGFTIMGIVTHLFIEGYQIVSNVDPLAPSNPLMKTVIKQTDAWEQNFYNYPWLGIAPLIVYVGGLLCLVFYKKPLLAFISSSLLIAGIITTVGFSMYPFMLPSSTHLNSSLTVWDASSSARTLGIMLLAVVIFLPIILAYVSWLYHVLRGKVTEESLHANENSY